MAGRLAARGFSPVRLDRPAIDAKLGTRGIEAMSTAAGGRGRMHCYLHVALLLTLPYASVDCKVSNAAHPARRRLSHRDYCGRRKRTLIRVVSPRLILRPSRQDRTGHFFDHTCARRAQIL
ncbi:hypothetical protein BDI4_1530008 [Burkholderia diffusa]|nr:hypothetical protein BDI4_1530008 [Burkholderia diffusa]